MTSLNLPFWSNITVYKTQYLIEGDIIFCPNTICFYHNNLKKERIPITSSAARLLYFLIKNNGEIMKREELLERVWDDYGLQASSNNLNQCLSTLRRIIKSLGIDKNIIETIPKVGLRIASDIVIEEIVLTQEQPIIEDTPQKVKKKNRDKKTLIYSMMMLASILMTTTLVNIFYIYNHYNQQNSKYDTTGLVQTQCEMPLSSTSTIGTTPDFIFPLKPPVTLN